MKENKLLTVFNTCGIKKDNTEWYIKSIESILAQDFTDQRVVLSSCMNSMQSFKDVYSHFRDKISYCYYKIVTPLRLEHTQLKLHQLLVL